MSTRSHPQYLSWDLVGILSEGRSGIIRSGDTSMAANRTGYTGRARLWGGAVALLAGLALAGCGGSAPTPEANKSLQNDLKASQEKAMQQMRGGQAPGGQPGAPGAPGTTGGQ